MKKLIAVFFSLSLMAQAALANPKLIDVTVKGMMCSSCAKTMKTKFQAQNGVQSVNVDLKKGLVHVTMADGKDISDDQIKTIVDGTDYKVAGIARK
jgi:copper chaperone CopZ